jgi:hypothetical protein
MNRLSVIAMLALLSIASASSSGAAPGTTFAISFPAAMSTAPLDGHITLIIAKGATAEPRTLISEGQPLASPALFGLTVDGLKPGTPAVIDANAFGWPVRSLSTLPAGDYTVQAVLNRYETFHLADGRVLKLPPDMGEGQQWTQKPGNLYSKPLRVHVDSTHPVEIAISLDRKIGPIAPKKDTPFIRHIRIRSELLSKYWGRPVYLGAHVLVPFGFDTHPGAHYPLMVNHGHFPDDIDGFRTTPPDPKLKPDYSERFHLKGYNRIQQEEAYDFYRMWISQGFPRFLVVEIQHANPYYDDSYAVNSANLGPYGDAINKELIPYIEKTFRGIGRGWARFTYGGSTGGWEALATQVFYPDMYNGAFVACPDPIDFHAYETINLYDDRNAYARQGQFYSVELPSVRDYMGNVYATQRDANYGELAQGDRSRSGGQYDIWQAVFSPAGADGYPKPIFDKVTGDIDRSVAAYWRDHYDLTHIIQREWPALGPKLAGKIHLYVGSADTYYLNNAVYYAQDMLEKLRNPAYGGEVQYGERAEHCWNGDPRRPNAYSRLHYNFQYLPKIMARIRATAPRGADLTSWRY